MKYYSEEEVIKLIEYYVPDDEAQSAFNSMIPIVPDRERIRMELWGNAYMHFIKTHVNNLAAQMATTATEAFDKQFTNS